MKDRPTCGICGGGFTDGEDAYASDWMVFGPGEAHYEVRYEHVACFDTASAYLREQVTA